MFQCDDNYFDCHNHICNSKNLKFNYVNDVIKIYIIVNFELKIIRQMIAEIAILWYW